MEAVTVHGGAFMDRPGRAVAISRTFVHDPENPSGYHAPPKNVRAMEQEHVGFNLPSTAKSVYIRGTQGGLWPSA